MIKSFVHTIRSLLGRIYLALRLSLSTNRKRLRHIEKFHVIVSDVVNTTVERVDHNETEILLLQHKLRKLEQFIHYNQSKAELQDKLAQLPEVNYVDFENAFRGSEELIRERQSVYIGFFENCQNVLDIGCGRGEFLTLLAEKQIDAAGIELDANMCAYCAKKGLKVICGDAFEYLVVTEDDSLGGVFSAQVIEHLEFLQLQNLLCLLQRKLTPGKKLVLETVNPLCPQAYQHFYTDLTHQKPLFPEVVTFIAQSFGLKRLNCLFRTPIVPDIPDVETDTAKAHLYGDYALVFEK